ncbi:GNAT family N-acetyltransferase [Zhouia amylolytica]|uniref:N-acetyltransferase GCN5 n=1 Tax=Zhouia amylolytica AD3 TaxID=1286632 RepID=W2UL31_9FLAO|nr:GNAT family N-acetyltransferase [Zhouia amylolytica]ETN94042.1 N-acetyltransferase GCN5 [Zhouia amylolytica AD3]
MNVIYANEAQLGIVRALALETWPATFKDILSPEQIDYMLDWMYSAASLKDQYKGGIKFILAEENDDYFGFAAYEFNYKNEAKTKIHKIYIHPKSQGKGVGRILINFIAEEAKKHRNNTLTLNVNRYNKATGFYEKLGFKTMYSEDIDIGNGYLMEDFVMDKGL